MKIIDSHVHVAPDVEDRCIDALQLAQRGLDAGYAGIVFKSPASETATMAALTQTATPGILCWGGIVLNDTVGGINPTAVESMFSVRGTGGKHHGRVVWMPTRSAINHIRAFGADPAGAVHLWQDGAGSPARPELRQVLEIIAAHDGTLATGHIGPDELLDLVSVAHECGVERIVITHVDFSPTVVPIELQCELVARGCYLEHCFAGMVVGPELKSLWLAKVKPSSFDDILLSIRRAGAERSVLSTDLGHVELGDPINGMARFIERCQQAGITDEGIERMVYSNCYELFEG